MPPNKFDLKVVSKPLTLFEIKLLNCSLYQLGHQQYGNGSLITFISRNVDGFPKSCSLSLVSCNPNALPACLSKLEIAIIIPYTDAHTHSSFHHVKAGYLIKIWPGLVMWLQLFCIRFTAYYSILLHTV